MGAIARRYVSHHFGPTWPATSAAPAASTALGDAELDEGACWEAIIDPMVAELGEVVWIVDMNRQSLDRVVPNIGILRIEGMFAAAGWQVITVKYGHELELLFARPGGHALGGASTRCPTPNTSGYCGCPPASCVRACPAARTPTRSAR